MSGKKRRLISNTSGLVNLCSDGGEPAQKLAKRREPSGVSVTCSLVQKGTPRIPRPTVKKGKEPWFDQYVYDWKRDIGSGAPQKGAKETWVDEPSLLAEPVREWLTPSLEAQGCVWTVDLRFGSLRGGWLDFYKRYLPLCTVPLLLREKSLHESGRAIFERASLRPRAGSQARESLHFLVAKTEQNLRLTNLSSLFRQLHSDAGSPAVVFLGWSTHDKKLQELELRDAFAAAAVCGKDSIFLLSLPENPSRAQQLALFLFSTCFTQWRTFFFEATKEETTESRFVFGAKGLHASWAQFLTSDDLFLANESLPADKWLEHALDSSGLPLSAFWSWKAQWRRLELYYKKRIQLADRSEAKPHFPRNPPARDLTVQKWLSQPLPGGGQVEDLLYWWAEDGLARSIKRSFLWADQSYTWESSFHGTKKTGKTKKKWFSRLTAKLQKTRLLPPHSLLLLEDSRFVVDLLLFPELNRELQHRWTKSQRLSFVNTCILPAQALRRQLVAPPTTAQQPLKIREVGEGAKAKGWQNSFSETMAGK